MTRPRAAGSPIGRPASRACDVFGNGVVRAARELRGGAQRPGQIVGSKNFHDFSVRLHTGPLPGSLLVRLDTVIKPQGEAPTA